MGSTTREGGREGGDVNDVNAQRLDVPQSFLPSLPPSLPPSSPPSSPSFPFFFTCVGGHEIEEDVVVVGRDGAAPALDGGVFLLPNGEVKGIERLREGGREGGRGRGIDFVIIDGSLLRAPETRQER